MMKIIFFGFLIGLLFVSGGVAHAQYYGEKPCSISVNTIYAPQVLYHDDVRSNPDGTVYPGDAIHFIFKYSGSSTCTSVSVKPLVGSENMRLTSSLSIIDNSSPKPHGVILYQWIPKLLTTYHYYTILDVTQDCTVHRGGLRSCDAPIYTLNDSPVFSYREDVELSSDYGKKIDSYRDSSKYHKTETQSWHLVSVETPQPVGVDEHVYEDNSSANKFLSTVKSNCSNLSKYGGCIFGHVEINTIIDNSTQICLFEELDKRSISYNPSIETNQCISKEIQNKISISVQGTGIKCNTDDKGRMICKSFNTSGSGVTSPHILNPNGEILFKYLPLYDIDGFYFRNNDGTYYPYDTIGVNGIPDVPFKENRAGTISFANYITSNTINEISRESCDYSSCDVQLSHNTMEPSTHRTTNGDLTSTHYSEGTLGLAAIVHESKMYNLNRYIGEYHGVATPWIVCYDPVISEIRFWSYLRDAGNTSFDNRYVAAMKYDGSISCDDDNSDILFPDRRVKITDIYSALVQSDNFGKIVNVTNPDVYISDGASIADMSILDSVRDMIGINYTVSDTYDGPILSLNHTSQKVQIDSAGFSQILLNVSLHDDYLVENFINVTSYNTLGSVNFGGIPVTYLTHGTYDYPWGFFSTIFNVTAYKYISGIIPCDKEFCTDTISVVNMDEQIIINDVTFTDSTSDSISLVEYYLYHHGDDKEFGFMHLSDLYEMNTPQRINNYTGQFLLNKTAIYYDGKMQDYLHENNLYGDVPYDSPRHYFLEQSPQVFLEGSYSVSSEISATNGITKTNDVSFDGLYMKYPINYKLNMNQDNYLDIHRATTAVTIPNYLHFGDITNVTINGIPAKNISCDSGCIVILPDSNPVDITVENQWGGKIINHNLRSMQMVPYDDSIWIDLLPMRLFWIIVSLVVLYVSYMGVKMVINWKQGNAM